MPPPQSAHDYNRNMIDTYPPFIPKTAISSELKAICSWKGCQVRASALLRVAYSAYIHKLVMIMFFKGLPHRPAICGLQSGNGITLLSSVTI